MTTTRWGILAPGRIAVKFADDLALLPDHEVAAAGSRSLERAAAFTETCGGTPYGSYEELVADADVDAVYVASPHALHPDHVRLALAAGKPVLCEKPLTLRTSDAEALFAEAREAGLLLMEAMWTACHPVVLAVRERLAEGEFGTPRQLHAELGFDASGDSPERLTDATLGGGALLDMGIYPLTIAHLLLGEAEQLTAVAALAESDIDLDIAVAGRYPGGAVATMTASLTSYSSRRAEVATERGRLVLEDFHHATSAVFTPEDGSAPVSIEADVVGRGYAHEAVEFSRCLAEGLLESPLVPHEQTLTVMRQMDRLREQVGVRYAGD